MKILETAVIENETDLNDPVKNKQYFDTLVGATVPKSIIKHYGPSVSEYESKYERFKVNYDTCMVLEYTKINVYK